MVDVAERSCSSSAATVLADAAAAMVPRDLQQRDKHPVTCQKTNAQAWDKSVLHMLNSSWVYQNKQNHSKTNRIESKCARPPLHTLPAWRV
jgi:hypothetical protein